MNLVLDIGNTRTKLAFFENEKMVESRVFAEPMVCDLELELRRKAHTRNCIISATGQIDPSIEKYLKNTFPELIELNGFSKLPFINNYQSKETQGPDRIAAVAGAQALYPRKPVLIIDAGTAITFDFINEKSEYSGGNISLGLSMRFKALREFTQKLPLLEKNADYKFLGKKTDEAIISGVQNGIVFEIEKYIEKLTSEYSNLTTIMTGGDADFLANKLKRSIFVHENLVLIGLNRILTYNAQI